MSVYDLKYASAAYKDFLNTIPGSASKGVVGKLQEPYNIPLSSIFLVYYDRTVKMCRWVDPRGDVVGPKERRYMQMHAVRTFAQFARTGTETPCRVIEADMPEMGPSYRPAKSCERELFGFPHTTGRFGITMTHINPRA